MGILQSNEEGGSLTVITSIDGGRLRDAIDSSGTGYETITSLTVTAGTLNTEDCSWINQNLVRLMHLEVGGTADFANSSVPNNAFSENKVLHSVKIDNATAVGKALSTNVRAL